ncbi:MAG TPA: 3-oxoacyl-ACP reductase FabG [Phycisphaerales bacterium]|nr:3-oxoacyl-ACP reductase FabG [Phycisphaerales bacterium]
MRLKDKVALITGGARGIGRATAEVYIREGARVAIVDVDAAAVEEAAKELGNDTLGLVMDVTNRESVQAGVDAITEKLGPIDILVNNAGIIKDAQLLKMEEADFDAVVSVNLKGVFNTTQVVSRQMVERGTGVILNASSVVALYGNFGQTNYVATKSGVIGMTKTWARELGRKGVRVNAVAPGFIKTRMTEGIPDKVMTKLEAMVPMQRMGVPEEIANAYLFLASDEASYVNGHVLSVDGGVTT